MEPSICIVTTTHDRPLCFSLLERWVSKQTRQPDHWLVINDSERPEEYSYTMGQQVIHRTDKGLCTADRNLPSLCKNWLAALKYLDGFDYILAIEDDDYYAPSYIDRLAGMLDQVELAGVSMDVYFKLPTRRFVRMHNANHASLAATGFRRCVLPNIKHCCKVHCRVNNSVFIDMYLWIEPVVKLLLAQPFDGPLHVGMKGMPGAFGLGMGHQNMNEGSTDPRFLTLQRWIGAEATQVYKRVWLEHFASTPNKPYTC